MTMIGLWLASLGFCTVLFLVGKYLQNMEKQAARKEKERVESEKKERVGSSGYYNLHVRQVQRERGQGEGAGLDEVLGGRGGQAYVASQGGRA
jgi:hypothetical protein